MKTMDTRLRARRAPLGFPAEGALGTGQSRLPSNVNAGVALGLFYGFCLVSHTGVLPIASRFGRLITWFFDSDTMILQGPALWTSDAGAVCRRCGISRRESEIPPGDLEGRETCRWRAVSPHR
jgi:hypothetical protein